MIAMHTFFSFFIIKKNYLTREHKQLISEYYIKKRLAYKKNNMSLFVVL
jgi:hypothetical protein